jgi:predicted methyltransferase
VYLQNLAAQGFIPNAPGNNTLRNPLQENAVNIDDSLVKFAEFDSKITEVRTTINDTQTTFIQERDQQVADLKNQFDTFVTNEPSGIY